jgi:UDP-N-acetylmuramoylalanine--D-glutamate ligase
MKDLSTLVSWHSDWRDLRVGVIGLGVSGFSVADTLAELGANLLVVAEKAEADYLNILEVLGVPYLIGDAAKANEGVPAELVRHNPQVLVTSPGVRPDSAVIRWAEENGIAVWVDIDLAWRLRDKTPSVAEWITITGTNGKTTTTQLVTDMLNEGGFRAAACGNIGTPILDVIRDPSGFDFLVVELSSFQLHYLNVGEGQGVSPLASAVLNIDYDHLDWHGGYQKYAKTKGKVYENTRVACVFNAADKATIKLVEDADVVEGCRAIGFGLGTPDRAEIGYVEDILVDRAFVDSFDEAQPIGDFKDVEAIGVVTPHLLQNIAAASALARAAGVERQRIRHAIRNFRLDAHRIQLVGEQGGIRWIDDSKATNPHAAAASLASFDKVVWIVGGLLKGVEVGPLVKRFAHKLRAAVVIGLDREAVLSAFASEAPQVKVIEISDGESVMSRAVAAAAAEAQADDVVLLAPSAASMDQFVDYADRGKQFAAAVASLLEAGA